MRNIGHFETYHDLDKSSAVVYIEKENSLVSIILLFVCLFYL